MVKHTTRQHWLLKGYTLIELMVVISVIAILTVIIFSANRSFVYGQAIKKAQLDLLSDLRSLQTGVYSGSNGDPYKVIHIASTGKTYDILTGFNGSGFPTPKTKSILNSAVVSPTGLYVCIVNPNYVDSHPGGFDNLHKCGGCSSGSDYYACNGTSKISSNLVLEFTHPLSPIKKHIYIDGNGITINRIYAD